MITKAQLEIAGELLEALCEDESLSANATAPKPYELPNTPANVALLNAVHNKQDEYAPGAISVSSTLVELAAHLSSVLQTEALSFEEGVAKAGSIDDLIPVFDIGMADLRQKWLDCAKNPDGTVDEAKAQNTLIAAMVTLKKFSLIADKLARPFFDRNGWRMSEKSIEESVEAWFKRPADGARGLRAVK